MIGPGYIPPAYPPVCEKCGWSWGITYTGHFAPHCMNEKCLALYDFSTNPIPQNVWIQRKFDKLIKPKAGTKHKCAWCLDETSRWVCQLETGDLIMWFCERCLKNGCSSLYHTARRN